MKLYTHHSKIICLTLLISLTLLTACREKSGLERATDALKSNNYDKAIDIFHEILEEEEINYEAWFGLMDIYIKGELYALADNTLENIYSVIDKHYDQTPSYDKTIKTFLDYAENLEKKEALGKWFSTVVPKPVMFSNMNGNSFEIGYQLKLATSKDTTTYYTLDGSSVTENSFLYKDSITFDEPGFYHITVATFNRFKIKSEESSFALTIFERPEMPLFDKIPGDYAEDITLLINNIDTTINKILYTADGSDPSKGYWYNHEKGIELTEGNHVIRAISFSEDHDEPSNEFIGVYNIEFPRSKGPTANYESGTYDAPITIKFGDFDIHESQEVYYTLDGSTVESSKTNAWWYDPNYGLTLKNPGIYEVHAVIFNYENNTYSEELILNYVLK